ncbi:hypothetical protein [Nodularia sp. NIES-3585]|uniref:hypothetical protein n=1 Tax=Nodularia sp. NIES-3585 TaxID=1973477 RepID=UPI000B5C6FFD|nr:hypothetical protein [Nodularia sp. NIES-3585]GAX38328.1 hypothetical protein NIES3585_43770 [Nodularia sp. NIES-3585]
MSVHNNSAVIKFELKLIQEEMHFYINLLTSQFIKQQAADVLIFGLIPYRSLLTVESYSYIQDRFPINAKHLFKYEKIIRNSRMRIKLFDEKSRQISGMFELINFIFQYHEDWFINVHKGYLSPLKKSLQPDLGIFIYDGHIIGSTHTAILFTGLEKEQLSENLKDREAMLKELLFSVSQEVGKYLRQLSTWSEFNPMQSNSFDYNIQDNKLGYMDVKSVKLLPKIFNLSNSKSINSSLFVFLCTINYVRYIIPNLLLNSPELLFKLKFITLYHLVSSLKKLQKYYYSKNIFTKQSKEYLTIIFNDSYLRKITSKKHLRNILVHYQIEKIPEHLIVSNLTFKDLIEYFFNGESFEEIDKKLDEQITRISNILEEWFNYSIKPNGF